MIEMLKKLFSQRTDNESSDSSEQAIHIACLALLIETGKSDHTLDDIELDAIIKLAKTDFNILQANIDALITHARKNADDATSLFEFTSLINENLKQEQKYQLILAMWKVAFADGRIDRYEEHIIRRVADLIYVQHARFIEAKLTAKKANH